ncbi:F-box protein [Cinnamomum micranthum f. kanehirae]|uniref:F-box protein n=1 Tax=Cinnamomum micranthum f. kanehirae TaxID=337451 RepID=A0A443Q4U7_9MAGN|nr:F-box protein [Cinnamomum micranthum f. kanehirae]
MGLKVDWCGLQLFFSLPDDILPILSASLLHRDLCNLSLCCRSLRILAFSDVLWHIQCSITGLLSRATSRRPFLSSYRALCRFLLSARPLLGVWVHDNPNQGNFVFVMLGFLSLIACRVIPQKVGPTGFNGDPLLRAPVFEISAESDGLHGLLPPRQREQLRLPVPRFCQFHPPTLQSPAPRGRAPPQPPLLQSPLPP